MPCLRVWMKLIQTIIGFFVCPFSTFPPSFIKFCCSFCILLLTDRNTPFQRSCLKESLIGMHKHRASVYSCSVFVLLNLVSVYPQAFNPFHVVLGPLQFLQDCIVYLFKRPPKTITVVNMDASMHHCCFVPWVLAYWLDPTAHIVNHR